MDRDAIIIQLLQERLRTIDSVRRDAATVLLDLCRTGWSKEEFAAIVNGAADQHRPDLAEEIRRLAALCGIAHPPFPPKQSPAE